MHKNKNIYFSYFLFFFSLVYFLYGFIVNENSAGAGGYSGDFFHTWNNLQIFLNNDFYYSIQNYYSNRSPVIYILHEFLNPFTDNQFKFRISVFFISLLIPVLLFFCLKVKFEKTDNSILLVISSIILFSPYVRTSGYWALEENFGILSILATFFFFNLFNNKKKLKFLNLSLSVFFSSLCVYFDLKLVIFPLIIFFSILFSKIKNVYKIIMILLYLFTSIPYLLLVYSWKNIFSPLASNTHTLSKGFYLDHAIYLLPILALYIFPLYLYQTKFDLKEMIKNLNFTLISLASIIIIYIVFFYTPVNLEYHTNIGKGFIFKIGSLIESLVIQKLFFFTCALTSLIFLMIYIKKNLSDWLVVSFLILLSIITYPLMQEYFDPIIFILAILFFKTKLLINYKSTYFIYLFFLCMGLFAKFYYKFTLNI